MLISFTLLLAENNFLYLNSSSNYLVSHCVVFNLSGEPIRNFNGHICHFFPDGSYFVAHKSDLIKRNERNREILKLVKIYPHHQINLSNNMNLLIMGSDTVQIKQKLVRMDVLYIISPKGEILKKFSFQQSLDFLIKNNILSEDTFDQIPENSSYTENHLELLHVNSFYQIPKQNKINSNKFFKENNYVVNSSNASHVFVLNESLDKIVALIPKVKDKNRIKFFSIIHDVQPTPNGELIVYNNYNVHDKNPLSKIEIYDSNFEKTLFSYTRENPERFLSKIAGGVQFFSDGTFLYSEIINDHSKVHYINKKGEHIKTFNIKWPSLLKGVQEMKAYDLASFIKFNIPY